MTATSYLVERLERAIAEGALQDFFSGEDTLVPVPGSGVTRPEGLWVPKRLAEGLMSRGLGGRVATLLRRAEPVAKSAFAGPGERPGPREHFESMMVVPPLVPPNRICLVDDVVTKGATLLGAANRLVEAFPDVEIRGFAAVRHVGFREEIDAIEEPCVGTIRLTESGDAEREP